ncbi:YidC/Oxa1 family membrane protein insertase [Convivina intestini]|uniref:Membrane protein insertase YidC n=1 Tax=Convivina intestini TaxID=1505726 RepID=A0A2U1D4I8_9LACO|nr:YidC/Oxa1 family membrane protein insertase [Convivina intestini]PVY82594.1 YidC/Oxa1 family membrane protein insertase [Convivina intestini]CAH1856881.1 Membrane protein insertase YidC 2 [Convivina intestini]CAH1857217.1 Membrane protein insertase YidC 2 [Convivina intestini]SDC09055.1 YidC/Oxa1 family membrane protein insertase [Leuconostocaceae bacterium R-53105]
MQKVNKWLKIIGPLPVGMAILALVGIVVAGFSYSGSVAGTGLWGSIVAVFTRSILGASNWFGSSYGLGIIIFTILIRFLILPLMVYQVDSMTKMQALQGEIKVIQAKYPGKDAESRQLLMNEQQALYKEHNVRPFASMLPLLVQMPILIALYQGILNSPVLRSGHFLWLELGQSDPYFILPILAALFTFASSWLSTQANPEQTTITKLMPYIFPVVIFFTALSVPSALSLYWVVGNIFQTIQTFYLQNPFKLRQERDAARKLERDIQRKMHKARRGRKRR